MGSEMTGIIFNIKRFSVHDGSGIRTTIFLKGCPLGCIWCHNPEGISREISIWYNRNICIGCGRCTEACPNEALTLHSDDNVFIEINRLLCDMSGSCVTVCPTGAIEFTGMKVTIEEIMNEIRKDTLFYNSSGGGVTLSGGEPFMQPEFSIGILKCCKDEGINTAVETCLYCEKEVISKAADYVDLFIADLKLFDPVKHNEFTGKPNDLIKDNLYFLSELTKNILIRVPLIKGITDSIENRRDIEDFVHIINPDIPVEYLDFNSLTKSKYLKLSVPYLLDQNI